MRTRLLFVLLIAFSLHADEVLDNAAIVRMVRAGLSVDVVMTKISRSQTAFDTSVDALITLKSDGVPDPVIKAMLVNAPATPPAAAPAAAPVATPIAPAPVAATPRGDSLCVRVQYYTLEGRGWNWKPALLCAGPAGIDIDEQSIPFDRINAHCFVLSALPHSDQEWWISDGTEIHKFRTRGNELQSISEFLTRMHGGIAHGSCSDRAVRKLLPATGHDGSAP